MEVILATTLFAILALGFVTTFAEVTNAAGAAGRRNRAAFLAEQGLEATRSLRNQNFSNLTDGTYGVTTTAAGWTFTTAPDQEGIFSRTITITSIASTTKQISADVQWQSNGQAEQFTLTTVLTNWLDLFASVPTSTLCQ